MRALAWLFGACVLGGCATGGAPYADFVATAAPLAADSARLWLYRAGDTPQYVVRSASVRIDGGAPLGLAAGRFEAVAIAPGSHRIVVDLWDVPGRCELAIEVAGGTERYVEVAPRAANAVATLPMALVPVNSFGTLVASGAVIMTGLTVEAAGKVCGGAFEAVEQPAEKALPRLSSLRVVL